MGRLDVKIRLKSGQKVNIEMQNIWFPDFTRRSIFYWAELFTEDFEQGSEYCELNKCIAINILNQPFDLSNQLHSVYRILEMESHSLLDAMLGIHFLDLTKLAEVQCSKLENWLLFIQTDNQEVRDMLAKDDILLSKANTEMNKFYSIAEERALYRAARREEHDRASIIGASRREGYAQGIDEGIAQGAYQANCKTARMLLQKDYSIDDIAMITGLSFEEIEKLVDIPGRR